MWGMAQKPKTQSGKPRQLFKVMHHPEDWLEAVCVGLEQGMSLYEACDAVEGGPTPDVVLAWVKKYPDTVAPRYARARETGYLLLGDKIDRLASETHAYTLVPEVDADGNQIYDEKGEPKSRRILVPLSADVMASKRLQVDTLKWKLSKMLPKVYGDKVTQEHTGANGGPITMAAVNLKGLSDEELDKMQQLMLKASGKE